MKYILKKYLGEIEVSDLDLENEDIVLGHNRNGWDYDLIEKGVNKVTWASESQEINIDDAINILNKLKKDGANYVEIMHHSDHHGYNFTALEMREATKEEIQKEKSKDDKIKELAKKVKIQKLEDELKKLKK